MPIITDTERVHDVPTTGLMQIAGADANIYTIYVASIIFNEFQLSVNGQRNIALVLSNLPYTEAPDERLTFGWGPFNVLRDRVMHQHGYEHLAIIVALASVFHESYASEVCHAYAIDMADDDDLLPHMRQWKGQVRSMCGCLAASTFAQQVEEYIRLDPYGIGPGSNLLAKRCRVAPSAMAKGLRALAKVVSKQQKEVTLVGGAVIGWFAAVAEWFYDLRVGIVSRTGQKLHGDVANGATQVILVYHEDPDLEILTDHWSTIQDKGVDDDPFWSKYPHYLPFGGRIQWHSLLPQVFGRAFWVLDHEEARTLADLLGAAARGLEADVEYHRNIGGDDFYATLAHQNSYGAGLIQNLTGWLPELRKGQGRMERQLKRDGETAAGVYDSMVARLQKLCNCNVCSMIGSEDPPKHGYCLLTICETIVALGLAISRLTVAAGIYPTREGVQGLYASQAEKRKEAKVLDITKQSDREKYYAIIYANEWRAGYCRRLQNAVELFSGSRPETDLHDSLVAIAHEGMCAYMVNLRHSVERRSEKGLIEVTSGAINVRRKVFTRMSTEPIIAGENDREGLSWEAIQFVHMKKPVYCK